MILLGLWKYKGENMVKFFKAFYEGLGNTKKQRFNRFLLLVVIVGIGLNLFFNIGYSKEKGLYWKPFDASVSVKK